MQFMNWCRANSAFARQAHDTVLDTTEAKRNLLNIALQDFMFAYSGKPASASACQMILEDMAQSQERLSIRRPVCWNTHANGAKRLSL